MRPASLRRAWKTKHWMPGLSGLTFEPLTANRGVAAWISSLRDIRASHSALPDGNKPNRIPVTCGHTSVTSWPISGQGSLFSRMSPTIYDWASNKSMMTYEAWVTALRRACLRRKKSVLRTSANDCSSWPTPRAQEPGSTSPGYRKGLSETARQWLTPRASETSERQDTCLKRMADRTDNAYGSLTTQATTWPTPLSRDWKDSPGMKKRETGQTSLAETAFQLGRQDHETSKHGDLSQLRLNPLFTEWLMGWPTGWTGSASVATAWCRWLPLMRSELLRLLSKDSHG